MIGADSTVSVWAWGEGYRQFFHTFPGTNDLRFAQLRLHVFNMNAGTQAVPLYPLLNGIDMRFKQVDFKREKHRSFFFFYPFFSFPAANVLFASRFSYLRCSGHSSAASIGGSLVHGSV